MNPYARKNPHTAARYAVRGWIVAAALAVSPIVSWTPAQAQDLGFGDQASTEQLMADQLVAMAWRAFGSEREPRPDQFVRANILLDMAAELSPDDSGMWELRTSLARSIQDNDMLIDGLGQHLRLHPKDDAAMLELIRARLSGVEALDEYLASLERLLRAEAASQLSAPLRSRLATLASQAAQEIGDNARHAAWLRYAVKLDPINPDAARMIYQLTLDHDGTARQQGAALINLIKASPVDPSIRIGLADLLMREAVYTHAVDQFSVAMELLDLNARLDLLPQYVLCLIASGQEDQVPPMLQDLQLFLKRMADAQDPDYDPQAAAEAGPPDPQDLPPLPTTLEFARLILLHEDNPVAAKASFQRLRASASAQAEPEQRIEAVRQLAWVGAVFAQDLAWVAQEIETFPADDEQAQLARGWLALRQDQTDQARDIFEQLGEENMFARLGLASLPGLSDKQRDQAYQQMIWDDPASMASVIAARRLHRLGKPVSATGDGVSLRILADNLSGQLWTPALTVSPWIRLKLAVSPGSFGYLQPMKAHVTIRNNTRMPLSVGPGGAVQSALMIANSPSIRGESLGQLQPTFFSMGRRLRLEPGASIQADIRLDRFDLSRLAAMNPTSTISFSTTAILDPRPLPSGGIVPGPLGATQSVGSLLAKGMPATPNNLQLWIADLDSTDPATRAVAIARLLIIARQPADSTEAIDLRAKVSDLINQRFPTFDPMLQAWTVRFMIPDEDDQPVCQRVIDLAQRSDDPMVRIVYLIAQVDDPESSELSAAIRHDHPTIRTFAQALREGLELDAAEQQELEQQQESSLETSADQPFELPELTPSLDDPWLP